MSKEHPADLLSAYHDGALTGAELQAAKELEKNSPEAQAELRGYQKMSAMLREVPPLRAPAGFTEAVLRETERRSLLPKKAERSHVTSAAWVRWGSAVASMAAALLIAVVFWPKPTANDVVVVPQPANNQTVTPIAPVPEKVAPETVVAKNTAPVAPDVPQVAANQTPKFEWITDLRKARPGAIVRAVKRVNDEVAVVHLFVVARDEGLSRLRVVLADCQVASNASSQQGVSPIAVELQLPEDKLGEICDRLKNEQTFVAAAVQEGAPVANGGASSEPARELAANDLEKMGVALPKDNTLQTELLAQKNIRGSSPATGLANRTTDKLHVVFVLVPAPDSVKAN